MKKIVLSLLMTCCLLSCSNEDYNPAVQPIAQTKAPMYITNSTATLMGNLLTGGGTVIERGFYYIENTHDLQVAELTPYQLLQKVMKEGIHVKCSPEGDFSYSLENLSNETEYLSIAYGITNLGTSYGDPVKFVTNNSQLEPLVSISLNTVYNRYSLQAIVTANIDNPGGGPAIEMGIVWSNTEKEPTIENGTKVLTEENVLGEFKVKLENMTIFKKYYVRAFSKNKYGISYSKPLLVMFIDDTWTDPRDSSVYKIKMYGNSVWMIENFRYLPPERLNKGVWVQLYQGDDAEAAMATIEYDTYGCLYDLETAKALTPKGWHLSTDEEWIELEILAGVSEVEANKIECWRGNTNNRLKAPVWGTNETGFGVLPGGNQWCGGAFNDLKVLGFYWTSTVNEESETKNTIYRFFSGGDGTGRWSNFPDCVGMSVRYVMD